MYELWGEMSKHSQVCRGAGLAGWEARLTTLPTPYHALETPTSVLGPGNQGRALWVPLGLRQA